MAPTFSDALNPFGGSSCATILNRCDHRAQWAHMPGKSRNVNITQMSPLRVGEGCFADQQALSFKTSGLIIPYDFSDPRPVLVRIRGAMPLPDSFGGTVFMYIEARKPIV
jgi:hypothetical protein